MISLKNLFGPCLMVVVSLIGSPTFAQTPQLKVNPETGETQAQFAQRTQWWRQAKFGMFIHWGIYSVPNSDHANTQGMGEWYLSNHQMQVADYAKYAASFDPVKFNARTWVAIAKAAGMKYITITSKHHDGFCMFGSKLTDYNVVEATPWHHDPMHDLAAECKRQGIKLCFYYSFMDWRHPDYLPRRSWDTRPTTGASLDNYVKYAEGQLRELLTNYGPIGGIWFDGGWEHNAAEEHSLEVVKLIRSLQPGIMINDRLNLPEDYSTPEQTIPANAIPGGRLWETCMTINDHWGYAWNDTDFKSTTDLVQKLCDIASKGGNFLLNVGPDSSGVIPPGEVSRLEEVGDWMKTNGDCIYGTTKSPFFKLPFDGRCTQKGHSLYLEVFHWPDDGLTLNGLATSVDRATAIDSGKRLSVTIAADGDLSISKPDKLDPVATVVRLDLAGAPTVNQRPESIARRIAPESDGTFVLPAQDAIVNGNDAHLETYNAIQSIGYWTNPADTLSWYLSAPAAGTYTVTLDYACADGSNGSTYNVGLGGASLAISGSVTSTGSWQTFHTVTLSEPLNLSAGNSTLTLTPTNMPNGAVMNLRSIRLDPEPQ